MLAITAMSAFADRGPIADSLESTQVRSFDQLKYDPDGCRSFAPLFAAVRWDWPQAVSSA